MEINYEDLKIGDIVWGCAFDIGTDNGHSYLKCLPVKGMIIGYSYKKSFAELKKNGEPRSTSVRIESRKYAATYEECVELYNSLIENKILFLERKIHEMEKEKIENKLEKCEIKNNAVAPCGATSYKDCEKCIIIGCPIEFKKE